MIEINAHSKEKRLRKFRIDKYDLVPQVNENETEIIEDYCSVFGCGKILSLMEKLCGDKCIDHQSKKVITFNANY